MIMAISELEQKIELKRKIFFNLDSYDEIPYPYYEILMKIIEIVKKNYKTHPHSFPFTIHDATHCLNVEYYIYKSIPVEKINSLRPREKFLLIASVWLHDIGMIPTLFWDKSKYSFSKYPSKEKLKELVNQERDPADLDLIKREEDTLSYLKFIRENHSDRSGLFIRCNKEILQLEKDYVSSSLENFSDDIDLISQICELHPRKASEKLEEKNSADWIASQIRTPLLIGYLRLADALHIPDKGEETDFLNFLSMGLDTETQYHWFKSEFTKKIIPLPKEHKIIVFIKIPGSPQKKISKEEWTKLIEPLQITVKNELQDELDSIKDILCKGGISFYSVIETRAAVDVALNKDYLIEKYRQMLKNIDLLFNTSKAPSSSLIAGNIVKTIGLLLEIQEKDKKIEMDKQIRNLKRYYKNVLQDEMEKKRALHALIKDIEKDIIAILKEYDTMKHQNGIPENRWYASLRTQIGELKEKINTWDQKRKEVLGKLAENSSGLFTNGPILLYGYSDTVLQCIEYILKANPGLNLTLYVCEVRSRTEYRYNNRLKFSDGLMNIRAIKQIEDRINPKPDPKKKKRITMYYMPDSGVSHLFTVIPNIKVILSVNAFDKNGNATHTLGARAITDCANSNKRPVYIITESLKFVIKDLPEIMEHEKIEHEKNPEHEEKSRTVHWLTTDTDFTPILKGCESYNPREDVIPYHNITKFYTEKGNAEIRDLTKII
jgi:translation initiation factor 2B subunit (eIF-2B alpha/beta/delta family)